MTFMSVDHESDVRRAGQRIKSKVLVALVLSSVIPILVLTFVVQNLYLLPAILLYSIVLALLGTFTMVALSSLSKSRRFTALTFTGLFFFTSAMYIALQRITGSRLWALISPRDMLTVIGDAAFRIPGERALPLWAALLGVTAIIGLSVLVLERRIRGVEVVK